MPRYVVPRQLVYPGDPIATTDYEVSGPVYIDNGRYRSWCLGLVEVRDERTINIVPLEGTYRPKVGDTVIGYVTDVLAIGWELDVRAPFSAYLSVHDAVLKPIDLESVDLTTLLNIGDMVVARITDIDVTREHPISVTIKESNLGRLEGGTLVEISPVKVPRVIGKKGSMIGVLSMLRCDIIVGQNGRIFVKCGDVRDEAFLASVIRRIERESHTTGLTDRIKETILKYLSERGHQ